MIVRSPMPYLSLACILCCGCGESSVIPPKGLVAPSPNAVASLAAEKFEVRDVEVTIVLPKNNPAKRFNLSAADADYFRNLPPIMCRIECTIDPEPPKDRRFMFGVAIEIPFEKIPNASHALGSGSFQRLENGKFTAKVQLQQVMAIELGDKAGVNLELSYFPTPQSTRLVKLRTKEGKVIIKIEE